MTRCISTPLVWIAAFASLPAAVVFANEPGNSPIVYYDLTPLRALKMDEDAQRWRLWD